MSFVSAELQLVTITNSPLMFLAVLKCTFFFFFKAIDELMTPEEKAKLFTAIGYSDSSHHLSLPKQVNDS